MYACVYVQCVCICVYACVCVCVYVRVCVGCEGLPTPMRVYGLEWSSDSALWVSGCQGVCVCVCVCVCAVCVYARVLAGIVK